MKYAYFLISVLLLCGYNKVVLANSLVVKDAAVEILVDGKKHTLQKDEQIEVKPGSWIEFIAGTGRTLINGKQLNIKTDKPHQVPIKKPFDIRVFMESLKAFFVSIDKIKAAVGIKGAAVQNELPQIIHIAKDQKILVIYDESFAPYPLHLLILDQQGEQKQVYQGAATVGNSVLPFVVPVTHLSDGYQVKILNAYGKVLFVGLVQRD